MTTTTTPAPINEQQVQARMAQLDAQFAAGAVSPVIAVSPINAPLLPWWGYLTKMWELGLATAILDNDGPTIEEEFLVLTELMAERDATVMLHIQQHPALPLYFIHSLPFGHHSNERLVARLQGAVEAGFLSEVPNQGESILARLTAQFASAIPQGRDPISEAIRLKALRLYAFVELGMDTGTSNASRFTLADDKTIIWGLLVVDSVDKRWSKALETGSVLVQSLCSANITMHAELQELGSWRQLS